MVIIGLLKCHHTKSVGCAILIPGEKIHSNLTMTERNFTKELLYTYYADMENGDDVESIDYLSLIHIITELHNRIEKLEAKLND
jgi:hypothetical protein